MNTPIEELIARLRWQPDFVESLRAQLARHPDVVARLRDALRDPRETPNGRNPSLAPLDGWVRH